MKRIRSDLKTMFDFLKLDQELMKLEIHQLKR